MKRCTSGYGGGEVAPAARIAEIICERVARHEGTHLVPFFWREDAWKRRYGRVIQTAHAALKIYHAEAVLAMLGKHPHVRSLVAGFARELLRAEQEAVDRGLRAAESAAPIEARDAGGPPRRAVAKPGSVRSRLKGL